MDKYKRDTIIIVLISLFASMLYMFYTRPVTQEEDTKRISNPTLIDELFCYVPSFFIMVLPVSIRRYIGGGLHG